MKRLDFIKSLGVLPAAFLLPAVLGGGKKKEDWLEIFAQLSYPSPGGGMYIENVEKRLVYVKIDRAYALMRVKDYGRYPSDSLCEVWMEFEHLYPNGHKYKTEKFARFKGLDSHCWSS